MLFFLRSVHRVAVAATLILAAGLAACQQETAQTPGGESPATTGETVSLNGAGASFPAPLYQRWFSEYNKIRPNVQISYQSVGSGAGVKQYLARTVDFGASDAPLTAEERQQFQQKFNAEAIQVPMTGGAVVFAYNLGGDVKDLKLSREAYCGIVSGEIKQWNAPAIAQTNPGVNLPNSPINFIHRSDGSGTTFIFTSHLEQACPNWKAGAGKTVQWPTGIGAKGNEGVTAQIQQTQGAIGYTEYSYAKENNLNMAVLENKTGELVAPSPESASAALEGETIPEDFALTVPDPAGKDAYPIVGLTWLLLYPTYDSPAKAEALKGFVQWALKDGSQYATELGYLPLSQSVAQRVEEAVTTRVASAQ